MTNCNCQKPDCSQQMRCNDYNLNDFPIAMAYVPWQHFDTVYELDKALQYGTIFPELNKPFYGRRGVKN